MCEPAEIVEATWNPGASRPIWQFDLRERIVQIGGSDGVGARRIRVREFTDSQIELRMMVAYFAGLATGPALFFVIRLFV